MSLAHLSDPVKNAADAAAVMTPIAIFFDALPSIAALLSVVWLSLRIVIAVQEHRLNRRKDEAQKASVKTYRQHLNQTLNGEIPKGLKRLLDDLK